MRIGVRRPMRAHRLPHDYREDQNCGQSDYEGRGAQQTTWLRRTFGRCLSLPRGIRNQWCIPSSKDRGSGDRMYRVTTLKSDDGMEGFVKRGSGGIKDGFDQRVSFALGLAD